MTLIRRTAVAAAAALICSLLPTQAARADGAYTCFLGWIDHGTISGQDCEGVGYVNVNVTLMAGPRPGTYLCRTAFSWNGSLSGEGCTG
ncbi:hypothetical protein [Nonomuraea sp. NPDC049646]|uniref:hypothetical protein n=1 Tax=unclassified Nonomuraea TaxID=2593643 RepID=UPI0037A4663C